MEDVDDLALNEAEKAAVSEYTKTELFGKGIFVVNKETIQADPSILFNALNRANIPKEKRVQYRKATMDMVQSKLTNCRSYFKKVANKVIKSKCVSGAAPTG